MRRLVRVPLDRARLLVAVLAVTAISPATALAASYRSDYASGGRSTLHCPSSSGGSSSSDSGRKVG